MAVPDPSLLEACRSGTRDEVLTALRTWRDGYLRGGPPPAEIVAVLHACADGLVAGRGDAVVAIQMFLFDVLMYVPPGMRTSAGGRAAPIIAAIEQTTPRLLPLRDADDVLVAAWSWHLLSWMPATVPGLAAEALIRLRSAERSLMRVTLALAAASKMESRTPTVVLLTEWLGQQDEARAVAAMVLAQLESNPTKPETTSDAHYAALLSLVDRGRWDEWEAAPAREHGYFADLATCLVRGGYARADTTLPALIQLLDVCVPAEVEYLLDVLLKILYHSQPYDGAAVLSALGPVQRSTLAALVQRSRVWLPRPRFYTALQELGLPLGARPMAEFLGITPPAEDGIVVKSARDNVLTVQTERSPGEIAALLRR